MSDTATPSPDAVPAPNQPAKPARTRGQKWRRRLIVFLVLFIVGVFAVRALVPILLPTVLTRVAGSYGLTAEYDDLDFSLLGGDVGIWNLRFTPKEGGEPLMSIGYCRGSLSTIGLLRGRLNVDRAEAEGARVTLERLADGTIPQLTRFLPPADATDAANSSATTPTNIPLEPPLTVRTLRLQQAEARLIDRAVSPDTDVRLRLNLMLNDIGSAQRPTSFSIQLNSPELLGALYVNGSATARNKLVNADLDLRMLGLNPQPLAAYLGAFGIAPTASDISASAKGKLTMTPAAGATTQPSAADAPVTAVAIKLELTDIDLTADSAHAAAVRNVLIDIPKASPGEIRIKDILVEGVRAYAWRDVQGRPGFAGLALGAAPTATRKVTPPTTAPVAAAPTTRPAVGSGPFIVVLQKLFVRDTRMQFVDRALKESPTLSLVVPEVTLTKLSTDPAHADIPSTLSLTAHAKGLARLIVLGGEISAAKAERSLQLKLSVSGIDGSAIDPYLKPLGITRAMNDASFVASLSSTIEPRADGSLMSSLHLNDVKFADSAHEWFAFSRVDVSDVAISANAKRIRFGNIDMRGPSIPLTRASDGSVTAFGFTYDPSKAQPAAPLTLPDGTPVASIDPPATQPASAAAMVLPVVEIGKLTWSELGLNFNDAMSVPPVAFSLADMKVEVLDLTLDPAAVDGRPGRVSASVVAPGNIDRFNASGTVAPTGEAIAFNISGDADGVTLAGLRPLMNALGLDPILNAGKLKFAVGGDVRRKGDAFTASASVRGTALSDASGEWLSVEEVRVQNASFDGTTAGVEEIVVVKPAARVERDSEGRLAAAGVRLITPPNAPPPPPVDPTAPPVPSTIDLSLPIVATLGKLSVTDAQVAFIDHGVIPAVTLRPTVNVVIKDVVAGADADPATLDASVQIPGVIEKLTAKGSLLASPTRQSVEMSVKGIGISGAALQSYLSPGVAASTANGQLGAWFSAQLRRNPAGGSSIDLQTSEVSFTDGLRPGPAFKLDSGKLIVDRFDLPGKIIAIKEVSSSGLAARVYQDDRGLVLPGLVVLSNPPTPQPGPAVPHKAPAIAQVGKAVDIEKLKDAARIKPPLVTIGKLNLGAQRLSFQSKQMAYPLAAMDLSLSGTDIRLLGDDPTKQPPFTLTAKGGVDRLVDGLSSTATLAPFATDPSASVKVNVNGIHANEVTTLLPDLAKLLDGNGLSKGSFTSELEAQFSFVRNGLFGIDLDRDITTSFTVRNTALTQDGVVKPLASVQEVRAEQVRVSPRSGNVAIKSLDVTKPGAQIVRDEQGITVLGVMLKMPTSPTTQPSPKPSIEPSAESTTQPAPVVEAEPPASQPVAVAQALAPGAIENHADVSVGSFTVTGIDLVVEDRVGKPTTVLPITELDLEVKGLNTQALRQPLPVKFSVLAGSGKTPFANEDGSLTEPREVFAQFGASGQVTVFPKPSGYIKSSLSAFELRSVKGIAQQVGIELGNGTFDFALDARMEGADTFNAKIYPTFNSLRMKDSPDGKVSRFLKIGAPLDLALVAVADADDAISIPVTVPFEAGKLDVGTIIGSVAGSVGGQVAKAVVAAPLKLAAMAGLNFGGEKDLTPVVISFAPGESMLNAAQREQVRQVAVRLKADATLEAVLTHSLASGDYVLTEQRANPSRDDASSLATQLRQQKFDLQKQQVELSSTLSVALASQNKVLADQTLARLQQTSTDLMRTEDSLDDMLGLLKPGASRQADRRSKQASIDLGNYRLLSVEDRLLASASKDLAARISKARPSVKLDGAPAQGQVEIKFARRAKQ